MSREKRMSELTKIQDTFISHLVLDGCTPTEAARQAGYSHPNVRAYELLRKPHVVEEIRKRQTRLLDGDLANVALRTLRGVMEDQAAPASARVAASRAVLEASGHFRRSQEPDLGEKNIMDMSAQELESFITQTKAEIRKTSIITH
jgi:phage terminase small subunit